MSQPLYSLLVNACPERRKAPVAWMDELPSDLVGLVVPPVSFSIQRDGEIVADRSLGLDANGQACFCAFRHVQTALRSDDDETFYEAPVHVETVTAWRLPDHRWLTSHQVIGDVEYAAPVPRLSLSTGMPR